jgi:cytochrome c556
MLAVGGAAAMAHSGATGIVKQRMDAMGVMGDTVKALSEMMRGDRAYDAGKVRDGAARIRTHAGEALYKLFPENSTSGPSEAKKEIWSSWEEFVALSDRLETLAAGLEGAADNGLMMGGNAPALDMSSMMGTSGLMGTSGSMGVAPMHDDALPSPQDLAQMPADGVFNMVADTCSSCHTRFRQEKH